MRVARLDIDEGFLDGLSVEFAAGLNVVIGARGVGKTSVLEILRYVLGARWFTSDAEVRSLEQVKSVLGSGLARVTLKDGDGDEIVVTRTARDDQPRSTGRIPAVTVLAQNEIEAVGAQPQGRLGLIDRFLASSSHDGDLGHIKPLLRSLTEEIGELAQSVSVLEERADSLATVDEALSTAVEEQRSALETVQATLEDRQRLDDIQGLSSRLAAQAEVMAAASDRVTYLEDSLRAVLAPSLGLPEWPSAAGTDDLLYRARELVTDAETHILTARERLLEARQSVQQTSVSLGEQRAGADDQARQLRSRLDELQEGLGEITKRVEQLREGGAQSDTVAQQLGGARDRLAATTARRRAVYDDLESTRRIRYERRSEIAAWLSTELAPFVRVTVSYATSRQAYISSLIDLLRGSNLRYNALAPNIAESLTPIEFVECIESADLGKLCSRLSIPSERAASMITYARDRDLDDVLVAPIEDAAELWLLDGADYKPAAALSIGQRCTAVLPILLRSESDVLIVDQPEDHLDNAFVAGALVSTLRDRSPEAQFIFASHNANVPVLGNADRIIHLDSDGKRGFVRHQGPLDDRESVQAVTDVMEGGELAFQERAAFYDDHR